MQVFGSLCFKDSAGKDVKTGRWMGISMKYWKTLAFIAVFVVIAKCTISLSFWSYKPRLIVDVQPRECHYSAIDLSLREARENSLQGAADTCPKCALYNLHADITAAYECMYLSYDPSPAICLYPTNEDVYVSYKLKTYGIREKPLLDLFKKALMSDSKLGVIDIGGNIGLYTVLAASLGRKVVTIEPLLDNVKHLHKAVKINCVEDRVVVLNNAVSNTRGEARLGLSLDNQGDTRLTQDGAEMANHPDAKEGPLTDIILLDDILPFLDFGRAVIKMDIQGFEHRALVGGKTILDQLYVPYILMEWEFMRIFYVSESHQSEDKTLVIQMISMLEKRHYIPCSIGGYSMKGRSWASWDYDMVWIHENEYIS